MTTPPGAKINAKSQATSLFFAGLLPVIAFTLIEEYYGTFAGLVAGMVFGAGEITYELVRYKKVQKMTWIGNGLLLTLGSLSLISAEGIWFKLQPALMEGALALIMWGSILVGKPLLSYLAEQQGYAIPPSTKQRMRGLTFRVGLFLAFHAGLASWAAVSWSSSSWALLKGVGFTLSFILYLVLEGLYLRRTLHK